MKKYIQLSALLLSALAWQSCGTKSKESADTTTVTTAEPVAETKVAETAADRKARIEKARMDKLEQKRLAAIEKSKTSPTYKDASGKIIYYKAEVDPTYSGGEEAMMKYLRDNLKYPKIAYENSVAGTVYVDFVVGANGKVREVSGSEVEIDPAVTSDVDQSLKVEDKNKAVNEDPALKESLRVEAERVVGSMPTWVAGRQQGKPVDASFTIPITFQLSN